MILVAGAGAMGASIAYHLALAGARDVVLCDRGEIAGGSTSRAMGGVRQQFSTAPEVELARESIAFFEALGRAVLPPGRLPVPRDDRRGARGAEERVALQEQLGVAVERVDPGVRGGLAVDDVLGAAFGPKDGTADPAAVARELVRRAAELGVEVRRAPARPSSRRVRTRS